MTRGRAHEVPRHSPGWHQTLDWAARHFDRALLVLGDTSEPLARHTRLWAFRDGAEVRGAAVRFSGFGDVMISALADTAETCDAAIDAARPERGGKLAIHSAQPLSARFASAPSLYDPWLDADCTIEDHLRSCDLLLEPRELERFYAEQGVRHYHPDQFELGHYYGVRDAAGALVSAGGINFVLAGMGYAQIGGLVTAPHARRRSYATLLLRAIRASLARAGIPRCGLFADAGDAALADFYRARGFRARGDGFRFIAL